MSLTSTPLSVRRVTGRIGAELTGVQLSDDLDTETVREIRRALVAHKVVFFRGQDHLDDTSQAAFGGLLGELTGAHPTTPAVQGHDAVLELDYSKRDPASNWHTDVTFVAEPPNFSVLRCIQMPEYGGDTLWANTATAYEELPVELRDLADRLWALHSNEFDYFLRGITKDGDDARAAEHAAMFAATKYEAVHPVVRVHPESEERSLLLGFFTRHILGFSAADSAALYDLYQRHITSAENTVRWRWSPGDVAIWDNRATQHYVVADFGSQPRVMRRVTIAGTRPVSITGEPSKQRLGDTSVYSKQAV